MVEIEVIGEKLKIVEYKDALIVPNDKNIYVYDRDDHWVPYTSKRIYGTVKYREPEKEVLNEEKIKSNLEVIYVGLLRGHWGHFLIDSCVRLWIFEHKKYEKYKKVIMIEGMDSIYNELFDIMQIDSEQLIKLEESTRFQKVFVPDIAYLPKTFISSEFKDFFLNLSSKVDMNNSWYERIYLSRTHFATYNKAEFGEKQIEDAFRSNGFEVIYPESLSVREQIWLYKNCKIMAATNGTISHNILFAGDGTELIIINRFREDENMHQAAINQVKKIRCKYVNCYARGSKRELSMLFFSEEMRRLFYERGWILPRLSKRVDWGKLVIFILKCIKVKLLNRKF